MHVLTAAAIIAVGLAVPATSGCAGSAYWSDCTIHNPGSQLDIGGTQTGPGSGGGGGGGTDSIGTYYPPPPVRPTAEERGSPDCAPDAEVCVPFYRGTEPPADEPEQDDEIPPVTLADLVSFVPAAPALGSEPAAAGVVGMPTNFVATASEQVLGGVLFDRPVTVRFTPVAFVFAYGDGATGRSSTGGASWEALGQAQFTATPTSHAYAERGTYVASVAVEYAPAVDFGAGWMPVAGVVTAATGGYGVEIYEVLTALVDRTCLENPAGPGC